MAKLGRYSKSYPVELFERFPSWKPLVPPLKSKPHPDTQLSARSDFGDTSSGSGSHYYVLQEDYTVTAGLFLDEDIAFNEVTDEWKEFCRDVLGFTESGEKTSRRQLLEEEPAQRQNLVLAYINDALRDMGLESSAGDARISLASLDLDSFSSLELIYRINIDLGIALPAVSLLRVETLGGLVREICLLLAEDSA